jgi:multiple sugar transport system ATP-binding protein
LEGLVGLEGKTLAGIALEHVTKRFGDTLAVDDVDLVVADGEFVVLLGPSGCGKSTVLRIVAGLDQPDSGHVRIGGRLVDDVEPKQRDVAMVFQSYALYPHMTVAGNIAFSLKPHGVAATERARRIDEVARMLDIEALLDRKPAQLSGGQRQRVALARAIVREPAAFLMDEPLSNLDAALRHDTRAELVRLHERLATTVLYVTHDQVDAMTMADRVAILDQGRLQQVGAPDEVYARPANVFVARFLGSPPMNVWTAETGTGTTCGGPDLCVAGHPLELSERRQGPRPGDRPLLVGIRPESLSLGAGGLPATVEVVESLGHERLVTCSLDDGQEAVVRIDARCGPLGRGRRLELLVDVDEVALFDAETGVRVP